jgi:hypothetical protein
VAQGLSRAADAVRKRVRLEAPALGQLRRRPRMALAPHPMPHDLEILEFVARNESLFRLG